jgi:hypothetical protein
MPVLYILFLSFLPDTSTQFYTTDFMELGIGARALGMGNAVVGLADDPTAFYWNPAGLARCKNPALFLMHSYDFDTIATINTAALIYPTKQYTLGIGFYWLSIPSIPITDSTDSAGYEVKEWINASDYIAYFSYARPIKLVDFGLNVKGIFRDWGITTAYGIETDCGLLFTTRGVNLGINFVNLLGSGIHWQDTLATNTTLPLLIKSGCSIQESIPTGKISLCIGFATSPEKRVSQFTSLHTDTYFGAEYWWQNKFAIRVGADRGNFSTGCGIVYRKLHFDYGIKIHPDLGLVKRLSGYIAF